MNTLCSHTQATHTKCSYCVIPWTTSVGKNYNTSLMFLKLIIMLFKSMVLQNQENLPCLNSQWIWRNLVMVVPLSAPNPVIFLLTLSPSLAHTHTRLCCAGKPNDQAEKPQVQKKKSQYTLPHFILLCAECFRCLSPSHYAGLPALPTSFASYLFSAVGKICVAGGSKEPCPPLQPWLTQSDVIDMQSWHRMAGCQLLSAFTGSQLQTLTIWLQFFGVSATKV